MMNDFSKQYLINFQEILSQMANQMISQKFTNQITLDFIRCMIPHHQAAIDMSQNLLQYTKYEPLQQIAEDIITMQTKGIEEMKEIYRTTKNYQNDILDVYRYTVNYYQIAEQMIIKMTNSSKSPNINYDFITEMIPHHEGAIKMCYLLLQYPINPRLRNLANTIIKEQSEGIRKLQNLAKNFSEKEV